MKSKRFNVFVILASAVLTYLLTFSHGFVFDDLKVVVQNSQIRSLTNLPQIFSTMYWAGSGQATYLYRPLTILSFALNYAFGGLSPWSYHAVNIFLHAANSALVYALALLWGLPATGALLAGLFFASLPVHVEAVANVAGRSDLLATLFLLAMALAHERVQGRTKASRRIPSPGRLLVPVLLFFLAMLSKEIGVVGIGIVLLGDFLKSRKPKASLYFGYAAAFVVFLSLRSFALGGFFIPKVPFVDNPAASAGALVRMMTAIAIIGKGMLLCLIPLRLSPDYSFDVIPLVNGIADARFVLSLAVLLFLGFALGWRRKSLLIMGASWYFLTLLPASNLLFPAGTLFGERLLYAPSVGFCLVLGFLVTRTSENIRGRRAALVLALALVLIFTARTIFYSRIWSDPFRLFSESAQVAPTSVRLQYNFAAELRDQGRFDEAEEHWRNALAIYPEHVESLGDLGSLYLMRGNLNEAKRFLEKAVRVAPERASAWYNLGLLYQRLGDPVRSREFLTRFVEVGAGEFPDEVNSVRAMLQNQ